MTKQEHRPISEKTRALLERLQRNECTEQLIYNRVADLVEKKSPANAAVLRQVADEEGRHAKIWQSYTGTQAQPNLHKVRRTVLAARLLGFTFAMKQMENGEEKAQRIYADLYAEIPEAAAIRADEERHEAALLELLDEERLHYVGSMVLGLNDALVELTGTLAGLTFAMQNNRLVALSGLITGASATLSMASSEYLSARSEGRGDALKSSSYTGIAYLLTVALLILPYLLLPAGAWLASLAILLVTVVLIIAGFTYYVSVAQGLSFRRRFSEMAAISLGVAVISFVIGLLVKQFLGIDL